MIEALTALVAVGKVIVLSCLACYFFREGMRELRGTVRGWETMDSFVLVDEAPPHRPYTELERMTISTVDSATQVTLTRGGEK